MVEDPAGGRLSLRGRIDLGRKLDGLRSQPVRECVPPGAVLREQVQPGEFREQLPGLAGLDRGEARGGGCGDVGPGMQAQFPEQAGRIRGQGAQENIGGEPRRP
jgi:hypothetical protein